MPNDWPEILLKKASVDRTFSSNESQWTQIAPQMIAPGWSLRFAEHTTGMEIIGLDPSKSFGVSIQPFFTKETSLPITVIIGTFFRLGLLPVLTERAKLEMELVARKELGKTYSVKLVHREMDKFETFDFVISDLKARWL